MSWFPTTSLPFSTTPTFDELLDDSNAFLKIPPLRSMFPSPSTERPVALEPATLQNMDEPTSKLTARQLALAHAKAIEGPCVGEVEPVVELTVDPLEEHNKKRRKLAHREQLLDFVQLPKPKPKLEEVNKKPFQPIAVLNQLNEPPPSAAMFPPITPSKDDHPSLEPAACENDQEPSTAKVGRVTKDKPEKSKRRYNRPRRKWTDEESSDLMEGVALCGVGRWMDILNHPKLSFHESRTHVDLKDRFRTLYPQHQPEKWASPEGGKPPTVKLGDKEADRLKSGKQYRAWSEVEDIELEKGLRKYGFQWHLIARDESLHFDQRTSTQIRDRFRRKYPDAYREAPLKPLYKRCRRKKENAKAEEKVLDDDADNAIAMSDEADRTRSGMPSRDLNLANACGSTTAPTFPSGLLNRGDEDDENDFTRSLAVLDNDLKLPPLQWDDMAVQPIFDLG